MLNRIDIHIEVPGVNYEKLSDDRLSETSEAIRARVQPHAIYKTKDLQIGNQQILSVLQIHLSGKSGSFASYRMKVEV